MAGTALAHSYTANMTIGDRSLLNSPMSAAHHLDEALETMVLKDVFSGVLGLWPSSALTLFDNMRLPSATQFLFDGSEGTVSFGDFNSASPGFEWLDIAVNDAWSVELPKATQPRTLLSGRVHFDTGSTSITLRPDAVKAYFDGFPTGTVDINGDRYYVDCSLAEGSMPALLIKIKGLDFRLESEEFIRQAATYYSGKGEERIEWCFSYVQAHAERELDILG